MVLLGFLLQKHDFFETFFSKRLQIQKIVVPLQPQSRTKATKQNGVVVQLVRIPACHAGGRGFESRPYRRSLGVIQGFYLKKLSKERQLGLIR